MIYSSNPEPSKSKFDLLLSSTLKELNIYAKENKKDTKGLEGSKLEPFIKDILEEKAKGTVFEKTIQLKSGLMFPDIIANKYYGIEVKSTTKNHWKTTGNSVLESTRVEGVERIYMLFGKLGKPMEFRCRPYEQCLSDVVVTHSPRYLIDMELPEGATIFDKMKIHYDDLRIMQPSPIQPIVAYYKSLLKKGEEVWWMGQDSDKINSAVVRIWKNINPIEQAEIRNNAMVFFPEIFGPKQTKFERIPAWLVTHYSVVCGNIRDLFTAGGQSSLIIKQTTYNKIPRILLTLIENLPSIKKIISQTPSSTLSEYWNYKTSEENKFNKWVDLITEEAAKLQKGKDLVLSIMLKDTLISH